MRVLHVVKTVDGAKWAVDQVSELVRNGIDVHVVLPDNQGTFMEDWRQSGAKIHVLKMELPLATPWRCPYTFNQIRKLISEVNPDIIHSHFFSTTLTLRYALGKHHPTPRMFQVPGPLHLEHTFFRKWELSSAGPHDYWIASSKYTYDLYIKSGIKEDRLFMSYYGNKEHGLPAQSSGLREKYQINNDKLVIGNINYMYPPKLYLAQTKGIKRHEDVIDALNTIVNKRKNIVGVLIGGQWGKGQRYENKLKSRVNVDNTDKILMLGKLPASQAKSAWVDFDVAIHVPTSENCGGVIEPLIAGVPVIASRTGGLPEVIIDGLTGKLISPKKPKELFEAISTVLDNLNHYKRMAEAGGKLVTKMFDVKRTAVEIIHIYRHVQDKNIPKPVLFDSKKFVEEL